LSIIRLNRVSGEAWSARAPSDVQGDFARHEEAAGSFPRQRLLIVSTSYGGPLGPTEPAGGATSASAR
jgi:hypothetical protein